MPQLYMALIFFQNLKLLGLTALAFNQLILVYLGSSRHINWLVYRNSSKYLDSLSTNHTSLKIRNSSFYYLLMCLKYC